jgi:outer membrane protein OmpA-like peptidoglycan-associated protein/outer membrane biosynthesis protein TonB
MNFLRMTSGFLALALMAGPVLAQDDPVTEPPVQAEPSGDAGAGKQAGEVRRFLMLQVPVSSMPERRLQQRLARARDYLQLEGLPPDQKQGLDSEIAEIEAELARRAAAASEPAQEPPPKAEVQPEAPPPPPKAEVKTEPPPLPEIQPEAPPPPPKAAVKTEPPPMPETQPEAPPPPKQAAKPKPAEQPQAKASSFDAEAEAMIDGRQELRRLTDDQLRQRLDRMRELLASRDLSRPVQKALRRQLALERHELRRRMRVVDAVEPDLMAPPPRGDDGSDVDLAPAPSKPRPPIAALEDPRPPRELSEAELRRRIMLRRAAERDARYSEADRDAWRESIDMDRAYLNRRMMEERRRREAELRMGAESGRYTYDLDQGYAPGRAPREDIFAAEADDDQIEEVLVAPPRRAVSRRYSVEEIEQSAQLREAVARIEIDTVNFGFGEAFLREEEIDNLDRIARVMEQILAANPGEVFMVEGHTDAVGSAQSNLVLSRQRAEAVKRALVRYYVIPPENLRTAGLGERFLKIPTEEPEAENRRVSVARITPLVGELEY